MLGEPLPSETGTTGFGKGINFHFRFDTAVAPEFKMVLDVVATKLIIIQLQLMMNLSTVRLKCSASRAGSYDKAEVFEAMMMPKCRQPRTRTEATKKVA